MRKSILNIVLALTVMLSSVGPVFADSIDENVVVSIGNDLTKEQEQEMLRKFGVDDSTKIVKVTNKEEKKYLGSYVSSDIIGTKAISCSYVEELSKGSGLQVESSNVSWVTDSMIINALATAGVEDAKVKVSAPFSVSGTAALTGVIKAFESATGVSVGEIEKQVANEEIAKTGELGQEIGKDKAAQLIEEVKVNVIEAGVKDPEEIRVIIEEKAKELKITLNEEQFNKIMALMENIGKLDLDVGAIKNQLQGIADKVSEVANSEEAKGFFSKVADFFRNLIAKISN